MTDIVELARQAVRSVEICHGDIITGRVGFGKDQDIARAVIAAVTPAILEKQEQALRDVIEALEAIFPPGEAVLEQMLWGHFSDDESGTITLKLGTLRRAREALTSLRAAGVVSE